jgi:preprotein translocase subunit SecA
MAITDFWKNLFSPQQVPAQVAEAAAEEEEIKALSDDELRKESFELRKIVQEGTSLDEVLPRAFAVIREASRRTLGQRHFDVQLWGGVVLHGGGIVEMMTGEGKTLAATAPTYLNALEGKGVHVITVNDYLAKRDAVWMGQIYNFLGLSVACIVHDAAFMYDSEWHVSKQEAKELDHERDITGSFLVKEEFLRPISRKDAYRADILYGTSHEFGFDYLRDNLAADLEAQVQRELNFAIIDEVDSILIDEARTPLIISYPDTESSEQYKVFAKAVARLSPDTDYVVDEKERSVEITDEGIDHIEQVTGIKDMFAVENMRLVHYLEESLKARGLFKLDKDYVVKDGEIVIVDQFTGRLMFGRRYSGGLHQAIEAKEGVRVQNESKTLAQISIQNYFRLYKKLAGMTGTAQTSAEEFHKVYGLEVVSIPPNKPLVRKDMQDVIYKTFDAKLNALVADIKARHELGQPVLLGTVSIEKNEEISKYLSRAGIPHEVLNAKNNEREGAIIAQAGRLGAVTVATNVAGRGVDIVLGGNPPTTEEARKIRELGGLHVVGTERHEARRIDNQLRGRSGRQGDPGSTQFYLSLEDDLMRIFGGDRIKRLMERFDLPEDMPIAAGMVSSAISQAQSKVEGINFDVRKNLLEYDDVLNKQRLALYDKRKRILIALRENDLTTVLGEAISSQLMRMEKNGMSVENLTGALKEVGVPNIEKDAEIDFPKAEDMFKERASKFIHSQALGRQLLSVIDSLWMNHLEDIEALSESVRIRAYAQKDPLVEYRRESFDLFNAMTANFENWIFANLFKIVETPNSNVRQAPAAPKQPINFNIKNVGRNDPCPCGAKDPKTGQPIKFKRCHGRDI